MHMFDPKSFLKNKNQLLNNLGQQVRKKSAIQFYIFTKN